MSLVQKLTLISLVGALAATATFFSCFSTVKVPPPAGDPLPVTKAEFPHAALDAVLKRVVDEHGRVDYVGLAADRAELERYLVALAETSPHQNPDAFTGEGEALTYWINAYNAIVLFAVTERPQMKSVHDDKEKFFYFTEYELGGEKMSLHKLENEVVRKEFKEPRIHFALNCASVGCPQLPNEAFVPGRLAEQLDRESRDFCADAGNVMLDGETVRVSSIFKWYAEDFVAGPIAFCIKHGRDDLRVQAPLEFLEYDWTLNAQKGRALYEQGGAPQ